MSEHQDSGSERRMELRPPVPGAALASPVGVEPAGGRRSGAAATGRDLAALANVLVARLPTTQAIQQARALGLRLLPEGRAVQLFAVEDAGAGRLVSGGGATSQHEGGVASSHDNRDPGDPLGFGALYDQQVLGSRKQVRAGDTLLMPLVTAEDALAGVLAVTLDDASARAVGLPSLASLSATLTVLVERWQREQARTRRAQALLALGRLADPPALGERGAVPGSEQHTEAEAQLLRDAGAVLRASLPPGAMLVLRADAQGDLCRVDAGEAGEAGEAGRGMAGQAAQPTAPVRGCARCGWRRRRPRGRARATRSSHMPHTSCAAHSHRSKDMPSCWLARHARTRCRCPTRCCGRPRPSRSRAPAWRTWSASCWTLRASSAAPWSCCRRRALIWSRWRPKWSSGSVSRRHWRSCSPATSRRWRAYGTRSVSNRFCAIC